MKISKSKRQLAQLLIEAGVKKFPNGADWAAQGSLDIKASFYSGYKPKRGFGEAAFCGRYCGSRHDVQLPSLINNWHQTVLSRDEFDQIVAETAPDADGWIEWGGGKCPVEAGALIDVKYRDLHVQLGSKVGDRSAVEMYATTHWRNSGGAADIIAYRLHKPEQAKSTAVGDDETNLAAKEELEAMGLSESAEVRANPAKIYAPSIESLAADNRNKLDYAGLKQNEADKAKADSNAALSELEKAIAAIGFAITPIGAVAKDHELVISDWRDLRVGDIVWVDAYDGHDEGQWPVNQMEDASYDYDYAFSVKNGESCERWVDATKPWRFIRRP